MPAWGGESGLLAAEDSHVIERCVIPLSLRLLHFCLEPTDGPRGAVAAPWSEVTPRKPPALQGCPVGAGEPDVVGCRVVLQVLPPFPAQRERNQPVAGAQLGLGPVPPPARGKNNLPRHVQPLLCCNQHLNLPGVLPVLGQGMYTGVAGF